jgi:branched-chain amino acid transport system substrate-binding protein
MINAAVMRSRALLLAAAMAACAPPREAGVRTAAVSVVEPVLAERPDAPYDGRLRIASIFPTLGRYALSGLQSHRGAELAVRDLNARGGVHGRALQLLAYRTGSHILDVRRAAELAAQGGALAIVGSNSSALSRAVAQLAEAEGVPQVSNVSTARDLTWDPASGRDRRFVFRVCAADDVMGSALATFAREQLGARRAAVLYEVGREYSAQLARSFTERFAGGERATASFVYLPLEIDFRTQLGAVAHFRPDVLFVPGSYTDATLVAIQAGQMGLQTTLLGGDGWSNARLFRRGGPARPAYYSDHCQLPPGFAVRYREAWGEEAEGCRAILAYDAVLALAAALGELGPRDEASLTTTVAATRLALRDALAAVEVEGEAGPIRFDEHGDVRRPVLVARWTPPR